MSTQPKATDKQLAYIVALLNERDGTTHSHLAECESYDYHSVNNLTVTQASQIITSLR